MSFKEEFKTEYIKELDANGEFQIIESSGYKVYKNFKSISKAVSCEAKSLEELENEANEMQKYIDEAVNPDECYQQFVDNMRREIKERKKYYTLNDFD